MPVNEIVELIKSSFDLTPWGITNTLDLLNVKYKPTATYGHFGRDDLDLPWEQRATCLESINVT